VSEAQTLSAFELPAALVREFDELCTHYPERRAALIPILHRVQEELGGWIRPEVLEAVARYIELEPVEVFGVASFYPMFHLRPVGRHVIGVCHNLSCELRGGLEVLKRVCELSKAPKGGTSPDGRFTVLGVECQGTCTNAPMLDLDGVFHERLTPDDVARILESAP
jgi:NADH:ubiquinone oxidoreductase subunit E